MPRSLRIQFPGALYHVMARGNRRFDWLPAFKREVYRDVMRDFFQIEL